MSKKKKQIVWGISLGSLAIVLAVLITIKVIMMGINMFLPDTDIDPHFEEIFYDDNLYAVTTTSTHDPVSSKVIIQKNEGQKLFVDIPKIDLHDDAIKEVVFEDDGTICVFYSLQNVCADFKRDNIYHYG